MTVALFTNRGLITILGSLPVPGLGPLLVGVALAPVSPPATQPPGRASSRRFLGSSQAADAGRTHFERGLRDGGIVVTIHAAERSLQTTDILQAHSADFGPQNRRLRNDPQYAGPERRLVGV